LAQSSGKPIHPAQLVKHGTLDPVFGVGVELDASLGVVFAQCVQKTQAAGADQLIELDALRQFRLEAKGEYPDFRRVEAGDVFPVP